MAGAMIRVDTGSLAKLGKQLRSSQPAVYREIRKARRVIGAVLVEAAKTRASWSTRIPDTIRLSTPGLTSIVLRAGGGKAPHAKAYEHAGSGGTFRHPVFPNPEQGRSDWTWVTQQARPFLHPAVLEHLQETADGLAEAITHAAQAAIDEGMTNA